MFKIRDGTLYKYTGNDKVVILPDEVEIIAQNAFDGNTNIEVIAGNKVKKLCYNSINTPNLKILKLPKVEEIEQLNDLKKIEYLKVNINTKFASIRYLNPNLKLELVLHGNESIIYTSNPSLLTKLDFVKDNQNFKEDFFLIVFNNKIKRFAINKKIENYTLFLNNISSVERFFNNIPNEFKEFIFDNDYSFCILNNKIILDDEYIGGITYKDLKLGLFSAEDINDCFIHEMARIIDDEYHFSSKEELKLCFKLESPKLYSKTKSLKVFDLEYMYHIIQNPHEYFCECFSRFYKKDNKLEEECPLTWDFLAHIDLEVRKEKQKVKSIVIN